MLETTAVRVMASKADLDDFKRFCEARGISMARAIRDAIGQLQNDPSLFGLLYTAIVSLPEREEWSFDKKETGVKMTMDQARWVSQTSRKLTTSKDWLIRMLIDAIRLGVIVPAANETDEVSARE